VLYYVKFRDSHGRGVESVESKKGYPQKTVEAYTSTESSEHAESTVVLPRWDNERHTLVIDMANNGRILLNGAGREDQLSAEESALR
jgi:hypothetical protein